MTAKKECRRCRQIHDGPPRRGERVVIVPKAKNSAGWAYTADPQKGVVLTAGQTVYVVTMDFDDQQHEVPAMNVKRSCGWKPAKVSRRRLTAFRAHKPLAEGEWSEPTLDEASS